MGWLDSQRSYGYPTIPYQGDGRDNLEGQEQRNGIPHTDDCCESETQPELELLVPGCEIGKRECGPGEVGKAAQVDTGPVNSQRRGASIPVVNF